MGRNIFVRMRLRHPPAVDPIEVVPQPAPPPESSHHPFQCSGQVARFAVLDDGKAMIEIGSSFRAVADPAVDPLRVHAIASASPRR